MVSLSAAQDRTTNHGNETLQIEKLASEKLINQGGEVDGDSQVAVNSSMSTSITATLANSFSQNLKALQNICDGPTSETTQLLGENVDLSMGHVSFESHDVMLPGNSKISMAISRVYAGNRYLLDALSFGDWHLNLPKIKAQVIKDHNDEFVAGWGIGKACIGASERGKR
ncbi:hypothetical protein [Aliikangiella maris]|uniref:Uncharacterized protein n=2 Tax=Aliikangiella maris TaxID=3162458 RepID=A0ABV3MK74_9GAMM